MSDGLYGVSEESGEQPQEPPTNGSPHELRTARMRITKQTPAANQDVTPIDPPLTSATTWMMAALSSYADASRLTISRLGDRDAPCAVVGGVVSLHTGSTIPKLWLECREPLTQIPLTQIPRCQSKTL